MRSYLVDTHVFLWWLNGDEKLRNSVRRIITDAKNQIYVSVASGWEISIKNKIGKLPLKTTVAECFKKSTFKIINIDLNHVLYLDKLPLHHKDPFDRILVAQSQAEGLTLITGDAKIWKYKTNLLKC